MTSTRVDAGIAVVGIAVRYPQAATLADFRANLRAGRDSVRPMSRERAAATGLAAPSHYAETGYLDDIHTFDYSFFNLSKREASLIDPQQRLALMLSYQAIEDAGYSAATLREATTAVVFSAAASSYPAVWAEPGVLSTLGNVPMAVPARISYQLGLTGACYAVDSGCNASLIAVHQACRDLRDGDADYALAGGVSLRVNGVWANTEGGSTELMSASGRCRAFDAGADGTAVGEGGAALLLTTLERARADRAPVHAVIRSSATLHSGHATATMSSPSARAQERVIIEAWKRAGLQPSAAGYLEAHGSGTPLGDAVELEGVAAAFAERPGTLPIGSVKTNIGHLDHAAGVTGLVKAILSVEHGELYPSLHYVSPAGGIDLDDAGIEVLTSVRRWESPTPRLAGVSSFSLGGINAHCVVEQPPTSERVPASASDTADRLFPVSARTSAALAMRCTDLVAALRRSDADLDDVAFTLAQGRSHHDHRVAVAARSTDQLADALQWRASTIGTETENGRRRPRVVLLLSPDPVAPGLRGRTLPAELRAAGAAADILAGQIAAHTRLRRYGIGIDAVLSGGVSRYAARYLLGTLGEVTAEEVAAAEDDSVDLARFVDVAEGLLDDGPVVFVELSPEGRLGRALEATPADNPDADVLFASEGADPLIALLGRLYEHGIDLDWAALTAPSARRVRLPGHPLLGTRCWYDLPNRP
ncbi:MAG: beta-ketoacyl synthase N-terminal-like domain-containing protein, partial [Rhodococcus sp. (in: high G+C Gram-positive bacteria)]|uniref:beta-ketoacyl synthase N-terminal-like domain-containing protein n=1 Tax=Rhodococcus sp. TaxID=1831 RepID=UPI003BAEDA4D